MFPSGPPGLKMDAVDQAVATVTGLRVGRYTFRLTVSDQEGATDSASLTVRVQEGEWVYSKFPPKTLNASNLCFHATFYLYCTTLNILTLIALQIIIACKTYE